MERWFDILQYVAWWYCTHATVEFTIEPWVPQDPEMRGYMPYDVLVIVTAPTSLAYERP